MIILPIAAGAIMRTAVGIQLIYYGAKTMGKLKIKLKRSKKRNKLFPNNSCGQCIKYRKCKHGTYKEKFVCNVFKPNRRKLFVLYINNRKEKFLVRTPQPEEYTFEAVKETLLQQDKNARKKGFKNRISFTPFLFKCASCKKKRMAILKETDEDILFQCKVCGKLEIMEKQNDS